jgi:hypothetical protein
MVRPEWPYPAARKQLFSDSSSGCSGAEEIARQGRPSEGESPQANAESLNATARNQIFWTRLDWVAPSISYAHNPMQEAGSNHLVPAKLRRNVLKKGVAVERR